MSFSVLPPEINSLRMFSGAGSGPMVAAAAAWSGLSEELGVAAEAFASVTSGLVEQAWQGPASVAMAAAASPYAGWLGAAAARAAGAAGQASVVAGVFEAARAAMVHPLAVAANRDVFVRLVLSNVFGQNAPAIAAAEGVHAEFWAADIAAMVGYHGGASAAVAQMASWPAALQGANLDLGNLGSRARRMLATRSDKCPTTHMSRSHIKFMNRRSGRGADFPCDLAYYSSSGFGLRIGAATDESEPLRRLTGLGLRCS